MSSSNLVSFPTSESESTSPLPLPHLPFRRISLPTTPSSALALAANRQSIASISSLDSLAEEPLIHQHRRAKRRSLNPATKSYKRTPADEDRQTRRYKIISEFYSSEKSYLDGLDLVYNHFLTPILRSLDTSKPLLTRGEITTLFSNFIDIWNFHHAFYAALSRRLHQPTSMPHHSITLSALLLSHFPYLSLYAPFVTAFPHSLAFLTTLSHTSTTNPAFAAFLRTQESHPMCAHLRLADYLLTPVQRCPRYLLLLKDLLDSTDPDDSEWGKLQEAQALVEKITGSLNASLAAHAQTLALISLQRHTRDLPPVLTPLVAPGRQLLKRGTLVRSGSEGVGVGQKLFEFLLLSDYLVWLEREETAISALVHDGGQSPRKRRVSMNALGGNDEEKWWCRGCTSLVDAEVVMVADRPSGAGPGDGERIEVLSPDGSFALYHGPSSSNAEDSNSLSSWLDSIRTARAARLAALALSNPDSTLSASSSGVHLRRALHAFASESDAVDNEEMGDGYGSNHLQVSSPSTGAPHSRPRRAQLDNFLPPVWVPDARTDACMRCGRPFGFALDLRLGDVFGWGSGKGNTNGGEGKQKLEIERDRGEGERHQVSRKTGSGGAWRRKHHCRLCGRVVCSACSSKTFYIAQNDTDGASPHARKRQKPKPARACGECYEAAFPFIATPSSITVGLPSSAMQRSSNQTPSDGPSTPQVDEDPNNADSIQGIQPWLSIPSPQAVSKDVSEALMAMDLGPVVGSISRSSSRAALSASPPHVGLNSTPSRKSRLSISPTKQGSPLRDTHSVSSSPAGSPSRRVIRHRRISSGDPDHRVLSPPPPSPLSASHVKNPSRDGGAYHDVRQRHQEYTPTRPIRVRPSPTRPRSYHDILEDFTLHERGLSIPSSISSAPGAGLGSVKEGDDEAEERRLEQKQGKVKQVQEPEEGGDDCDNDDDDEGGEMGIEIRLRDRPRVGCSSESALDDGRLQASIGPTWHGDGLADDSSSVVPREDTARRKKRFSMPAVALQTAPVFARARQDAEGSNAERRRSSVVHDRERSKKGGQGEKEGSAVGLLMEVLRGKIKYPGGNS